jgi:hypothetical protein
MRNEERTQISHILSSKGQTLIEIAICLGLLGMVILAIAQSMQMGANTNASTELDNRFTGIASTLMMVLSTPKLCSEALKGQTFKTNKPVPQLLTLPMAVGSPTPMVVASPGPTGNGFVLQNIEFNKNYGNHGSAYALSLHIEGLKQALGSGQKLLGTQLFTQDYMVNVNIAGSVITGCN